LTVNHTTYEFLLFLVDEESADLSFGMFIESIGDFLINTVLIIADLHDIVSG
jgi:hypothetical protein